MIPILQMREENLREVMTLASVTQHGHGRARRLQNNAKARTFK